MTGTLLVPLDGSEVGEAVLPWAAFVAERSDLTLLLARVVAWPTFMPMDGLGGTVSPDVFEEMVAAEREVASEYLEGVKTRIQSSAVRVHTAVQEGFAAERLLDLADETSATAIAMSTHGRGGVQRALLGSVAERILQQATQPILLVRADAAARPPALSRLLVPVDGSPLAERVLDTAQDLLVPGGQIDLLRVVRAGRAGDAASEAQRYLDWLKAEQVARGVTIGTLVKAGDPAAEIIAAAREQGSDLIVMATHGYTGPARIFLGSVADAVSRTADRPVLLVSARALAARAIGPYAVSDVMTRGPVSIGPDESLIVAVRKLLRRRVAGLPVVNERAEVVGLLSEHDLLAWESRAVSMLRHSTVSEPAEFARRLEEVTVKQIMTTPAVTVDEDAPLADALHTMLDRQLRRLPVTSGGKLVGVVSRADVLKAIADQWSSAVDALGSEDDGD